MKKIDFKKLLIAFSVVAILVLISMILTKNTMDFYENIKKPLLAPPSIVFPIVWSILYIFIAITLYRFLDDKKIRALIITNLVVNVIWPILFFRFKLMFLSIIWLILIILTLILELKELYKKDKKIAFLNIPYLLWLFFALYLNVSIFFLNM